MLRFRVAVATAPFRLPLKEAISTAARLGAQGIQFDLSREVVAKEFGTTAVRQLVHYVEERNLQLATATFSLARPLYDYEGLDVRVVELREAMDLASRMHVRQLAVRMGRIPEEADAPEHVQMTEILRDLSRHGNRIGVSLCITPSDDAASTLLHVCHQVGDGLIGVDFDPATVVMARRDPITYLKELHEQVMHITFRDGRRDVDGTGVEVPVGRGQVKWDELLAMVDEVGYSQWGTVRRTAGEDRVYDCQKAIQYLRHVAMGG